MEELEDYISDNIRYNALSNRMSKLEQNEFDKFMKPPQSESVKKAPVIVDHQAQIKMAKG